MSSFSRSSFVPLVGLALFIVFLNGDGLSSPTIEGLDGAHHVMDGVFFRDFLVDRPFDALGAYPYDYYAQYPALGFIFWPPLFPFVEGLFFLAAGEISLFVTQLCMLFYALLAMVAGFFLLKPRLGIPWSALALVLLFGSSEFIKYQNQVRLEVPTLAMGLWCMLLYQSIAASEKPALWRLGLFSLVGAGALYTKQTAFPMLAAIGLDVLLNQRHLLRQRRFWGSGLLMLLLVVPLALFTLKYGQANIAQAVGTGTSAIMEGYVSSTRYSLESWLYYPKGVWQVLHPSIVLLAAAGLLLSIVQPKFRRDNALWLAWIGVFYFAFSYFDNRTLRFGVLLYPPLVFLAVAALVRLLERPALQAKLGLLYAGLLLASLGLGIKHEFEHVLAGFRNVPGLMQTLDIEHARGNMAYQGRFRQLFVYHFRKLDPKREHYFLQADDILGPETDLLVQLGKYRVQYLFVESTHKELMQRLRETPEKIKSRGSFVLQSPRESLNLTIFEFTGELAEEMTIPQLKSKLL